jgi:small subunit ribosomal protein S16
MPVKIRLQRHGKKGKPFYWVVAADARAKRDGRYLEKIGTYNPNTDPATVDLDIDAAVKWLENGAQPTDTARTLLSYRGALLKHHLKGGVSKGALTQEDADAKLEAWLEDKENRIQAKVDGLSKEEAKAQADAFAAEKAVNEQRVSDAKALQEEAATEAAAAVAAEEAAANPEVEEAPVSEEVKEVAPVSEEVKEVAPVSEEAKEEAPVSEEVKEVAPVAEEAKEEAPVAEEAKEEAPEA